MSDENHGTKAEAKAKAKEVVKKRSVYQQKSMLELPEWAKKDKAHKYYWTSNRRLSRSDNFDPRGWSIAKDPSTGEMLKVHDVILSRMPLDEHEAMVEYKVQEKTDYIKQLTENMEDKNDRLRYEVERLGGKIGKTEFSIDKKQD